MQKYLLYSEKFPNSKIDVDPEQIAKNFPYLLKKEISQKDIDEIVKKIKI